jgi:plasmid stabilization system protein ParE
MPDAYHIRITPEALANLEEVFAFIQKDSPQNATGMIRRLLDSIDGLRILPPRYDVPHTGHQRDLRTSFGPISLEPTAV